MKLFSAYIKRNKKNKIDDIILVKEGFSFWALILGPIWFLYHKMFNEFFVLAVINLVIGQSSSILSLQDKIFIELVIIFFVSVNANHWYCLKLQKDGYKIVNIIRGKNKDQALIEFIDKYRSTIFRDFRSFDSKLLDPKFANHLSYKFMRFFRRASSNSKLA